MSGNLRIARPNDAPLVEACWLQDQPSGLRSKYAEIIPAGMQPLTPRAVRLKRQPEILPVGSFNLDTFDVLLRK